MTISGIPPTEPSAEAWRTQFKQELTKLESSYWVIRQPINPIEYERVVTDIHLQCQEIFNRLGELDIENSAHLLNYISAKNQQVIRGIERRQNEAGNKEAYEAGIQKLWGLEKRVMDVALNLAVAHEQSTQSLAGRVTQAASTGLDIFIALSHSIPIVAEAAIHLTDDMLTVGVNHLASQYIPSIAKGFAPEQLLQGRHPDLKSFALTVLSEVTKKKIASLPIIGDSRTVHRALETSAKRVTSFEEKIFAPLQQKLLTVMAPGNFQQMLSRALVSTARCIELIQAAEQQPGDLAFRKEFLIRRLLPGASTENYAKRIDRQNEALVKKFLGGEEQNPASKVVKELLVRFSRVSGLTNLIIATTVETLTQVPQPAKLPEPQLGQALSEIHRTMERDYPVAAEILKATGGWQKMRSLEHYADIASLYVQNQLLEKAVALITPSSSTKAAQTPSLDSAVNQLIDTVHALATSDKTWDQYWLRLFSSLPKKQILKRIDWDKVLAEPLRSQWHHWIAGK